jgi:Tfp pilus assembly protein PilF
MEVAVQSVAIINGFSLGRVAAIGLLVALAGCGSEVISYNRQFREQGMTQFGKADYADAASSFSNALRQEPGDYTSRYYLGQCEERLSKIQAAIKEYRTCLDVMSHSLEGKGDLEFRSKVLSALANAIAQEPERSGDLAAIERAPRTAENAFLLAKIYRQTGDADSAIAQFEQAQQIDPQNPEIAKEYGLYLEQLGQTKRADGELRRAYTLNSKDEEVAAALRRLGVVPGPSLKGEDGLEKPVLPLGPLPEVDLTTSSKQSQPPQNGQTRPGPSVGSTGSPRD